MALRVNQNIFSSCQQEDCESSLGLAICGVVSQSVLPLRQRTWEKPGLQHVLGAVVILVISVVVKVWTVIGCCHKGKGAFVLLWVHWLLFYADMMHSWQRRASRAAVTTVAVPVVHGPIHFLSDDAGKRVKSGASDGSGSV